jgi:hypothetical protein
MQTQDLGGMGTGNVSTSEKRGLTSDHILSRLQGELQKSCEMGVELHNLTGGSERYSRYSQQLISEHFLLSSLIYIKLLPQHANLPPCPCALPPFDLLPPKIPPNQPNLPYPAPAPALTELQTQLHDIQSSLTTHVDKLRALGGVITEHHAIKCEIGLLR